MLMPTENITFYESLFISSNLMYIVHSKYSKGMLLLINNHIMLTLPDIKILFFGVNFPEVQTLQINTPYT